MGLIGFWFSSGFSGSPFLGVMGVGAREGPRDRASERRFRVCITGGGVRRWAALL